MISLEEIKKLSVEERLQMVEAIWDSIEGDSVKLSLTPEQKKELDRRIEKYERGEGKLYSWEEIKQRAGIN